MLQDYWDKLYEEVRDITRIQICTAIHGWKRLHSALVGVVHKSIGENRPALPQFFELSSPKDERETFFEHRVGRYAPYFRKCIS
ncbi:hypothetical protein TNCV_2099261 [Trichonephila clavipes]|nr:hypothetical protein TNCV_2099261 [Trichonephila clavipes]